MQVNEQGLKEFSRKIVSGLPEEHKFADLFVRADLNHFFGLIFELQSEIEPRIKIQSFTLSKLAVPIDIPIETLERLGEYVIDDPEFLIDDMEPLTINKIKKSIPIKLSMLYELEIEQLSRIKVKGNGQLKLYRENDGLKIETENEWDIEEIEEIEPNEPRLIEIAEMVIAGLIVEIVKLLLEKYLLL